MEERLVQQEKSFQEGTFYILHAPAWLNIIALTPENEIILVEQYRHGIEQFTLELPGGMSEPEEALVRSAQRELLEETGFTAPHQNWEALGRVSFNPAIANNYTHTFLVRGCRKTGVQQLDEHEEIAVHTIPVQKFGKLIRNHTIHHALVVAAYARLVVHYPELAGL